MESSKKYQQTIEILKMEITSDELDKDQLAGLKQQVGLFPVDALPPPTSLSDLAKYADSNNHAGYYEMAKALRNYNLNQPLKYPTTF